MFSSYSYIFFLVTSSVSALDLHSVNGRLLRGNLQAKSAARVNSTQSRLQALGASCKCQFTGMCSCVQALEFMQCIRDACGSGACDCQVHHYFYACKDFSSECPSAGLKCGVKDATCKKVPPMVTAPAMKLVREIETMQQDKCKLEEAVDDGFINGKVRLAELEPQMQDRTEALKRKGIEVPTLGCSDDDLGAFQEFKVGLEKQKDKEQDEAEQKADERMAALKTRVAARKEKAKVEEDAEDDEGEQKEEDDEEDEKDEKDSSGGDTIFKKKDSPWRGEDDSPPRPKRTFPGKQEEDEKVETIFRKEHSPWQGDEDMPKTDAELIRGAFGEGQTLTKTAGKGSWTSWMPSWPKDGSWFALPALPHDMHIAPTSWVTRLLYILVNFLICTICAWIYDRYRLRTDPFAPQMMTVSPKSEDDLGVGLFSCFSDIRLTLFTCCCPCLRWADTLDRAGLLNYRVAFIVFAALTILSPYTFGITSLLLVFVCFRYRQRLRKKYYVSPNPLQDFLAYFCCGTCAVVQEARIEANRSSRR